MPAHYDNLKATMDNKYQISFVDEVCLAGKYRGKTLEEGELQFFPNNCIGLVRLKGPEGTTGFGSGCLISSCTVLTAAHLLFSFSEGQLITLKPFQFCLNVYEDVSSSNKIIVTDYCYPKRFEEIYKEMATIKPGSTEHYNLIKQSELHDYALLKLEKNVKQTYFPTLYPNFDRSNQKVIVCGYSEETSLNYYQIWHANTLYVTQTGGIYDIDTKKGQSGSPVYFTKNDEETNKETCYMVGIHKGHDKKFKKNICTLITSEVMSNLQNWLNEMKISFETKAKSQINSDLKSQQSTILQGDISANQWEVLKHANVKLLIENEKLVKNNLELQQKNKELTSKYEDLYMKKKQLEQALQQISYENKKLKEDQEYLLSQLGQSSTEQKNNYQNKLLESRSHELNLAKAEILALKKTLEVYQHEKNKTTGSGVKNSHSFTQSEDSASNKDIKNKKFKSETEVQGQNHQKNKSKLLESPPGSGGLTAEDYYNLANKYKEAQKPYEAIIYYRKCIELDPKNMLAYNNLSVVLFIANQWEEAVSCLKTIIKNNPSYTLAYDNLYRLFKKRPTAVKQLKQAIQLLQNILVINSKNKPAKQKIKQLKQLLP